MVSAYNTPWVICTKYVLSNYFTTLGIIKEKFIVPISTYLLKCLRAAGLSVGRVYVDDIHEN